MKVSPKRIRKMVDKPQISPDVKKKIQKFDQGANLRSHQYKQLKDDHYDALSLLQALVDVANFDGRVEAKQSTLIKQLHTNQDSLNFDLLSLDRLGMVQIDLKQLAENQDQFTCKLIPHHIFH